MVLGSVSRPARRRVCSSWVLGLAVVLGACSSATSASSGTPTAPVSARPGSPAKVQIITPTNGEEIHDSTVAVKVKLIGATIVQATSTNIVPTQGHLHLYLDDQIESMNFSTATTIGDVSPGLHTLKVEFVASDHLPFDPRVIAQVAFEVRS
jgi:hypothetical protein